MTFDSSTATERELDLQQQMEDLRGKWGEPDWSILDDRRGNLPEFPENVLSAELRDYIERASRGSGVTFGHVAVPLLSIASAIVGTSRRVQASRSFVQPVTFWAALIGFSGSGKTPAITVTIRALAEIVRMQADRIAELQRKHETKAETAKAAHKQWTAAVQEAVEAGKTAPAKPADAMPVGPFVAPRLYVSNTTIEKVAVLIQARPAGLAVIVDELSGLFANMNRYSGGSDREFWLEAWNGNPYTVERMGRDAIVLDRLLVGVTGGMQPDKLATAFEGDHDGMYARLCFAWPSEVGYRPLSNDVDEIEPELINALSRLVRIGEADSDGVFSPRLVPLSADAMATFEDFRRFLHAGRAGLEGREAEWWAKGTAQVLRIAGTLAMLEWAWIGGDEPAEIGANQIGGAVALWSDYFWPHSRAAIRVMGSSRRQANERRVLLWLQQEGREIVSVEDVRRSLFHHSLNAAETTTILDALARAGWLSKKSKQTGGKPLHRWAVNPMLHIRKAQSAESAESPLTNGSGTLSALSALSAEPDPDAWASEIEAAE